MNPCDYFNNIVEPTLKEFYCDNNDLRKAMLSAMCMLHVVDCIATSQKEGKSETRKRVEMLTRDLMRHKEFEIVRGFALTSKHFVVHNSEFVDSEVEFSQVSFPAFAGIMVAGATFLGDLTGGIVVSQKHRGEQLLYNLHSTFEALEKLYSSKFPELMR